jgi:cytochrome P450
MAEYHPTVYLLPAVITLVAGYFLCTAVYNVYFHPLSKFPGPKLYAASQIPITIDRLRGDEVMVYHKLHAKYGQFVRVAPGELSTINPAASRDVYGHRNAAKSIPKDFKAYYMKNQNRDGTEGLMTADDDLHRRQRKIFSPAFSDRAIREQEPLLKKYTDLLIEKIGVQNDLHGKVDMVTMFNFCTFDFISDCVFGDSLHLLERMEHSQFLANISAAVKFSAVRRAIRSFPFMDTAFDKLIPAHMKRKRREHVGFCESLVDKRLEKAVTDHPDFWTLVLQANEKGEGLSLGEMHQNSFLFLTAATETTSSLMSALTYLLCENPDKMRKIVDEIRRSFNSIDEMNTITLPPLEYLQMCIEEGLRVYPPVPGGLPRRTTEAGGSLDGHELPPDTVVYYAHYAAYHSEAHFARPDEFHPERWAAVPPPEFANDCRDAVIPFSAGPRDCIGKNLAYHESRLILAKFLFTYDVELCEESHDWLKQKTFIVGIKKPLYVKLRRVVREK